MAIMMLLLALASLVRLPTLTGASVREF